MFGRLLSCIVALFCFGAVAGADTAASMDADPQLPHKALVDATAAFFDRVEAFEAPKKRRPVIGIPVTVTTSRAGQGDAKMLTRKGPVRHLTGYRVTWYPLDRLLGTVDFMGTWNGNRNLVCGYLTWDLSDPEEPILQKLTASFVDMQDLSDASEEQVHRSLIEANCAFGSVDDNYRIFDVSG